MKRSVIFLPFNSIAGGRILLAAVLWGIGLSGKGQALSNIRFNTYALTGDTLLLDTLSIVPGTLWAKAPGGAVIDSNSYTLHAFEGTLTWNQKPKGDSIKVFYRVYPFKLGGTAYHKDYKAYNEYSSNIAIRPFLYKPDEPQFQLIDFGNLDYNGTFSRSLSFGSNQNVVLNSNFNLQLAGMLTRDLEITAAVTDNNIPIQPDGNTQQIQEFDKIFIQLRKDQHRLIMGDFDLGAPTPDYFMRFNKKYQGGYYTDSIAIKKVGVFKTGVAGGIAKGIFARNTLAITEGNQGPYKLIGTHGETYIIILANSEGVFINGVKMERGADRDYVIDYNLGTITFTPRRIISKDLRVVVEFQYSQRNYLRTAGFVNTELITKKASVHFNLFSEQDSKGQNVQQDLNAGKKLFLSTIGDSTQNAFYPGYDSAAYDANRILYRRSDTAISPFIYNGIFTYATDSTEKLYAVNFSYVGEGKGNYIPAASTANGRVYSWVAPFYDSLTNSYRPSGSYEPVILLVAPAYQQLYTLGSEYRINGSNTVAADVAMSNVDPNMFSKINNGTHLGFAGRFSYKGAITTRADTVKHKRENVNLGVNYEFVQNRFNFIERYRNVEFARDWNLENTGKRYNEHLLDATAGYQWSNLGRVDYRFRTFIQDSVYKGFENALSGNFVKGGLVAVFSGSYLSSSSLTLSTGYLRPKADISYGIRKARGWRIGAAFDHELNRIMAKGADTLAANSFLWQNYKVYLTAPDTARNKYRIEFTMRYEQHPDGNTFKKPAYSAQAVNFTGALNTIKNQTLNYTLTYRHTKNGDSLNSDQPEHFYLGRIDYGFNALKGVIRGNTLYELGTGREQKTQISFQASPTNQGDYIWNDDNEDGIKQINEFQAQPYKTDTSYVKVFVLTPEYVSVNTNQFNQVLNINPSAVWNNAKGAKKLLAKFSLFASVQVTKKTYAGKGKKVGEYFNPIPLKKEDERLVSTAISSRNTLYFNRLESKYGLQADFNYSQNRTLLTSGFENRILQSQGLSVRWNAFKAFNITAAYINGFKANQSDFYAYQRYRFTYNDANSAFSYQFKTSLRMDVKYEVSLKRNPTDTVGTQSALVNKLTAELRYNRLSKSTISASLSYASIQYKDKGFKNEQLEYAMLEGLHNGSNLVWSVGYEQNLLGNIQLSLSYDGRMTGFTSGDKSTIKPVHTGRAEIRALF